ncbi:hypothetical protein E2C01_046020 [Portunus trituberculatus]|uniref:Uncharacterized protein n=1 Tax=Portunus trituberculatus TaxID=210409 RepID=A0A5B7G4N7_PORTR|nr:hypothetical protein [Portunus trituberculatus]
MLVVVLLVSPMWCGKQTAEAEEEESTSEGEAQSGRPGLPHPQGQGLVDSQSEGYGSLMGPGGSPIPTPAPGLPHQHPRRAPRQPRIARYGSGRDT